MDSGFNRMAFSGANAGFPDHVTADVMEPFASWLMSDGYGQYRQYGKRLRCLAHIIREARGLVESCHPEASEFGK
ncbi:MAG: transposase [Deltaproteobacteria bacterium]|nr:transposase [Deltaproteobacteria bacterium]